MEPAFDELRRAGQFRRPGRAKLIAIRFAPMAKRQVFERDRHALEGPQQPRPPLHLAVVGHQARCGDLQSGAPGLGVDEQLCLPALRPVERLVEREGAKPLAAVDGEDPRLGAACRMDVKRAAIGDHQALGRQGLDADVIVARGDGALDPRLQQLLEGFEQRVLQIDAQREQPVEKGRDRRQIFPQAAVPVGKLQTGRVLEHGERAARDLAGIEQHVELAQRRARIDGFEVVVGAEQALAARLALALGDRAERVEPACNGGEEALFRLHVGRNRPEQRRLRLVGAVGAA